MALFDDTFLIDDDVDDPDIDRLVLATDDAVALIGQIVLMAPVDKQQTVCEHALTELADTVESILGARTFSIAKAGH